MVSRILIAFALSLSLAACDGRGTVHILGTEAIAVDVCRLNGGVERIETFPSFRAGTEKMYDVRFKIWCKNNNIIARMRGYGETDGQLRIQDSRTPVSAEPN